LPYRNLAKGLFNHEFGNSNTDAVHPGPATGQDFNGFAVVDIHPHPFKNLEGGKMNPVAFRFAHTGISGAGHVCNVCTDHRLIPPA